MKQKSDIATGSPNNERAETDVECQGVDAAFSETVNRAYSGPPRTPEVGPSVDQRMGDEYDPFAEENLRLPQDYLDQRVTLAALDVSYGMEADSLAVRLGVPRAAAAELLQLHREIFWVYWEWSDNRVSGAMLRNYTDTTYGWRYHVPRVPPKGSWARLARSLRNFPIQGNGAEILRLACCYATEADILVCCPIHDAMLIKAPLERLDADIATTRGFMEKASARVLNGFVLRTEAPSPVRYPDRYMDEARGRAFWERVMALLPAEVPVSVETL
jgi:hypothetical protein